MNKFWETIKSALLVAALFLGILLPGILAIGNIVVSFGTVRTFIVVIVMALGFPLIYAMSFPIYILMFAVQNGLQRRELRDTFWNVGCWVAWHMLAYSLTGGNMNARCNQEMYAKVKEYDDEGPKVTGGRLELGRPIQADIIAFVLSCICLGVMLVIQLCAVV